MVKELKSSIFADSVYEGMDWFEQVCAPVISTYHEAYHSLPETIEVHKDDVYLYVADRSRELTNSYKPYIDLFDKLKKLNSSYEALDIESIYTPEINAEISWDFSSPDPLTINGVFVLRKKECMSEKEFTKNLYASLTNHLYRGAYNKKVLQFFTEKKYSSQGERRNALFVQLEEIFVQNSWNINNLDILVKLHDWLIDYAKRDSLVAKRNILQLKCMTMNNNPIYSIKVEL